MNFGGEAADQVIRYSLDGIDHGLRLSGTVAKNLAVFFAAVLKDQKKSHGKTRMIRMLRENRPLKFFTIPTDRLKEFAREGKKRGLLYVVIKDRKNPELCELMVFADDAAKVNRVMDRMQLDFLKSECGEAEHAAAEEAVKAEAAKAEPVKTEAVSMPEGEIQFEISDFGQGFEMEDAGNFTQAQETKEGSPSGNSSRSRDIFMGEGGENKKPSVKKELEQIKREKQENRQKKNQRNQNRAKDRRKKKKRAGRKGR